MSCCDSRDDRVLRVFPEEESNNSYINTAYSLLQNVVNRQGQGDVGAPVQVKEKVVWTKIERWNPCRDCVNNSKLSEAVIHKQPFFLITIALENSLQLWLLYSHGACDLVCSLGGEDIRIFQHLICPKKGCRKRFGPLAIKVSANVGLEVASLLNLRSFDEIEKIQLPKSILSILNNESVIALAVPEEIYIYSNDETFTRLFCISSCYYDPALNVNPMALGAQWLAFADARLVHRYECGGGVSMDVNSQLSYTSVLISAAQTLGKGLISITGSITAALTRSPSNSPGIAGSFAAPSPDIVGDSNLSLSITPPPTHSAAFLSAPGGEQNGHYMSLLPQQAAKHPGVVTIINCSQFAVSRAKSNREAASGLVAHFPAHTGAPLAFLQFNANGSLLATADTTGREFNVFRILAHPSSVSLAAVHHLYSLHRGDTTATVVEMSFSPDSRWLVVGTHRGTAHVFPITPYGGSITRRTHCRKKVPNRFSRFHQSAGLDSLQPAPNGTVVGGNGRYVASQSQGIGSPRSTSSPLGMGFPASSSPKMSHVPNNIVGYNGMMSLAAPVPAFAVSPGATPVAASAYPCRLNSRLPPYPHPVPVRALYQIKQVMSIPGLDLVNAPANLPAFGTNGTSMSSLSVAPNNVLPGLASVSMAFSPSTIYRASSQLVSAAASLSSLTGSGLSNSLGGSRAPALPPSPGSTTLCLVTWQGDLIEYKISPRVAQNIPPEKLSQDSPIELDIEIVARWPLVAHLQAAGSVGGVPGPLYSHADISCVCPCAIVFGGSSCERTENCENCPKQTKEVDVSPDIWVSQVETFTCSSPSRRIWSGPQFSVQQYSTTRSDSANSLSPRPSVSSVTADLASVTGAPSRTSLSTSPNVCQSEDSAFGDQDRAITPPSSASSSASGSLMTLPLPQTRYSCPVDIRQGQQQQQFSPRINVGSSGPGRTVSAGHHCNASNNAVAVLEAYSSSLDACMPESANVEAELLAAAVQDLQF